jgi:hypothetical protein
MGDGKKSDIPEAAARPREVEIRGLLVRLLRLVAAEVAGRIGQAERPSDGQPGRSD